MLTDLDSHFVRAVGVTPSDVLLQSRGYTLPTLDELHTYAQ